MFSYRYSKNLFLSISRTVPCPRYTTHLQLQDLMVLSTFGTRIANRGSRSFPSFLIMGILLLALLFNCPSVNLNMIQFSLKAEYSHNCAWVRWILWISLPAYTSSLLQITRCFSFFVCVWACYYIGWRFRGNFKGLFKPYPSK